MTVATYTTSGAKATVNANLPKEVFAVEIPNHQLLKDAYLAYLANQRPNLAKTLKRGEVRGGGIKPWRQKGTGRARFGSIRNPIWTGGGVAFGPTGNESYKRSLNVKAKHQAIRQALSLAVKDDAVVVIDSFELDGKTKSALTLLAKIKANRHVLMVVDHLNDMLLRATANLTDVTVITAKNLTVYHVLNADKIIFNKKSLAVMNDWLGSQQS